MSRIGKQPIPVPDGVTVSVQGRDVSVKGTLGELSLTVCGELDVAVDGTEVKVTARREDRETKSYYGLNRTLIANMIQGVSKGFEKSLEIEGVGYRVALQGRKLELALGFSSPVIYELPEGVNCEIDGNTKIKVSGADKQKVGDVAARIRAFAPAEPYKGKGVRYAGERIRRKVGKTVA